MSDTDKTIFEIDLDTEKADVKADDFLGKVKSIGDSNNLSGLIEGLTAAGPLIGALGVAALAVKVAFDSVFDAEKIQQINNQFDAFTKNAGLAGNSLKSALIEAGGGRATETEIIQAANKALIELGSNASKIPQIMTLARQATAVFGGDVVERFEAINQAIATGSERGLRQQGIIVNFEAAYVAFAKSVNKTTSELSDNEKQQARLNAILEKGSAQFKGTNIDINNATTSWQLLKTSVKEAMEGVSIAINTVAGPAVRNFMSGVRDMASDFLTQMKARFGEGADAAKAKTKLMGDEMLELKGKLVDADQAGQIFFNGMWVKKGSQEYDTAVKSIQDRVDSLKGSIAGASAEVKKIEEQNAAADKAVSPKSQNDPLAEAKSQEQKAKFEEQMTGLEMKRLEMQEKIAQSTQEVQKLDQQEREVMQQNLQAKMNALQAEADQAKITEQEKNQKIEELQMEHKTKMLQMDEDLDRKKTQALDNYMKHSTNAMDGEARAFAAGSQKNQMELVAWGKAGAKTFDSFGKNAQSSLEAWGAGTKTASEAARGFVLGMLADEAESRGMILLLASIWPPNPIGLAAGAGLVALSGALRAMSGSAGGGGMSASAGASAGGGDLGGNTPSSPQAAASAPALTQQPRQTVSVTVQGHYFDTEQSNRRFVDMLRDASDQTDFQFNKIG